MKLINYNDIKYDFIREICSIETHEHQIIQDKNGELRWLPNELYIESIKDKNFNDVVMELISRGLDKNCEEYRKVYRDIGYSLMGYWEIFYLEVNNTIASEYIPNRK